MGPIAVMPPVMAKNMAMYLARFSCGAWLNSMPMAEGNIRASPAPCTTRDTIIHASAREPCGVSPHRRLPMANAMVPASIMRLYPSTSASFPATGNRAAAASR